MVIEKSLAAVAAVLGVVFVGVVGYKIIKKQNPNALKGVSKFMASVKDKASEIAKGAAESFSEGYSQAS
jgi:hypothetical protein